MEHSFLGSAPWHLLIFLACTGFLSGFIDSIVGGGGLISVPAMLLTGLPPSMALGSNKGSSIVAAAVASIVFYRSGKIDWNLVKKQLPFTLIGSILGTILVVMIPPLYLKLLIILLLVAVMIFVLFKKDWGQENKFKGTSKVVLLICLCFAFVIGMYDGFIGPGTGTFLIVAYIFTGFDFLRAAGNAKILNFASNLGSLIIFTYLGQVVWLYSIAMAVGQFAGAFCGSHLAIAKGSKLVRYVFIISTSSMIIKLAYDYINTHF